MKKVLKFVIVISVIFTLLSGNIAVIAANIPNETQATVEGKDNTTGETSTETEPSTETPGTTDQTQNETVPPGEQDETDVETNDDETSGTESNLGTQTLGIEQSEKETNGEEVNSDGTDQQNSAGDDIQGYNLEQDEEEQEGDGEENDEPQIVRPDISKLPGKLRVVFDLRMPQQNVEPNYFNVELKKSGLYDEGTPIKVDGVQEEKRLFYTFDNLPAGAYTLKISAEGYQTIAQKIEIQNNVISELNFTNGYDDITVSDNSINTMGVVGIGDIDRDGNITDEDVNKLFEKIEGNQDVLNYVYDLNKDGEIDIVDLSYALFNKNKEFVGSVSRNSPNTDLDNIQTSTTGKIVNNPKDPQTTDDIEDLLKNNDKYITFAPEEGQVISEEHPIQIGIEIGDDTTETQFLSISPSKNADNNITDGIVTVDGYDYDNHVAVQYICQIGNATIPKNENEKETAAIKVLGKVASTNGDISNFIVAKNPEDIEFVPSDDIKKAEISENGTIVINFKNKIAVKRVIIKVTGTTSNNLADISKVEFLNSMEDKIPEPDLNVPTLRVDEMKELVGEDNFTVKWNNEPNVTAYEVFIGAEINGIEEVETHIVEGHQILISQFKQKAIKDLLSENTYGEFTKYHIRVRSLNGSWASPYSDECILQPGPSSAPQAPTGVSAKGAYQTIKVTWNKDPRAVNYFVYYKKVNSNDEFKLATQPEGTTDTTFTITGLESSVTKYEIYVMSNNTKGMSPESEHISCDTVAVQEIVLPKYKLINESNGEGQLSKNIKNITFGAQKNRNMKDSPLDTYNDAILSGSAKGVADNSFGSYFQVDDWDFGGFYNGSDKGIIVEFEQPYKTNYITMAQVEWNTDIGYATIYYDDNGTMKLVRASQVTTKRDVNGNRYTAIKLSQPITTTKMAVGFGNSYSGNRKITIAEMGFYEYDDIEDKINNLFADNMHLTLAEGVTEDKIAELERELNDTSKDKSGELNPEKDALAKELETARDLLQNKELGKIVEINSEVTDFYDSHIEFKSGLNAWQPLGIVARAGEEMTIYVGNPYKNVGESTRLQLIATQWRAESNSWQRTVTNLVVGKNVVTIPNGIIDTDRERGGSLYINYTGLKDDDPFRFIERNYAVRIVGGEDIPVLDLSSKENKASNGRTQMTAEEKKAAVKEYVTELADKVSKLPTEHEEKCIIAEGDNRKPTYGEGEDCILGTTEIVLDQMMYSVSSKQIYEALAEDKGKEATIDDKADALYNSLTAMEDMVDLFYSQKGLVKSSQNTNLYGNNNLYPRSRLNIRCMRMTGRAFMYAGGSHIGIQWNEVKDLSRGVKMQVDSTTGKRTGTDKSTGNYFGWGIAHEIGHVINQKAYVHGEVTNNYFSILAQTDSTRDTVRFNYEDVYKKVTSGKTGKAQNVFTQLGLYWQLHLAYDQTYYDYKTYSTQKDQFENSIYARIDTYARNLDKDKICTIAPTPTYNNKGVKLQINSDTDNNLMRLACAATQKNVLEFFVKWGMEPNEDTIKYAEQWETETRAIWYVNDEARSYVINKNSEMGQTTINSSITNANGNRVGSNKVEISLGIDGDTTGLLGYEIVRTTMSNDQEVSRPVAFVEAGESNYTDIIDTMNNRVFTYKIVAYDKYLNKVAEKTLDPVKVEHEGEISQDGWEITTNMISASDANTSYYDNSNQVDASDEEQKIQGVSILADGKKETEYVGATEKGEDAEITISLPEVKKLVGLKYTAKKQIENYEIQVSSNGKDWTTVRKHEKPGAVAATFTGIKNFFVNAISNEENTYTGSEILDFTQVIDGDEIYNYDYDCSYVKFIIHDNNVAIQDLDLLGQSGDNVEFEKAGSIGKLKDDFTYDADAGYKIPAGSIIFTGTYKGNPAYNVVKLWFYDDETSKWQIVEGYQVILAPDPGEADLGETRDGSWVYVVEEKEIDLDGKYTGKNNPYYDKIEKALGQGKVRAELYRVDNANTNEGERLVSDTLVTKLPETLDNIGLNNN